MSHFKIRFVLLNACLFVTAIPSFSFPIGVTQTEEKSISLEKHHEKIDAPINPVLDARLLKANNVKFDQKEWKTLKSNFGHRQFMLYDLVHSYPLIGMKRVEVTQLLGNPNQDPYTKKYASDENVDAYHCVRGLYFQLLYKDDVVEAVRLKSCATRMVPPSYTCSNWVKTNPTKN